jgi:hypothetical protein
MGTSSTMRMTWNEICSQQEYRGRWLALDGCRYDETTAQPAEGTVIDADDDLAELCQRIRRARHRSYTILFCERQPLAVAAARSGRTRASTH